jgi:2-methylcitrate dehydratase PrpD
MVAALLAQQGFTADPHTLEGRDGWGQAISSARRWDVAVGDLGRRYEAALNTYKPFPCGIVAHPALDAAIQLRGAYGLAGAEVVSAELHCNPLVQSLTGKRDPKTGLESKFSVFHGIAVGLLFGAAGERQFSDAMATDPTVARLRDRISLNIDPAVSTETCDLTLRLADGRVVSRHIAHAVGSLEAPMSNGQLEAKFADLADGVLPPDRIRRLMALCWDLERSRDAGAIGVAGAAA